MVVMVMCNSEVYEAAASGGLQFWRRQMHTTWQQKITQLWEQCQESLNWLIDASYLLLLRSFIFLSLSVQNELLYFYTKIFY